MGRYRGRRKLREKEEWGGGGKFVMTFKYNIIPSVTHSHTPTPTHNKSNVLYIYLASVINIVASFEGNFHLKPAFSVGKWLIIPKTL